MISVFEGGERRRTRIAGTFVSRNESINVAQHIAERVGPPLLMSAGQMRIGACARREQRRILGQHLVRGVAMTDPQFVLPLLDPAQRRLSAVDLEPQAVLVSGTDL